MPRLLSGLTSLIYISRSLIRHAGEGEATAAILATSRRNNRVDEVTGALLLDDGQFMQVLEGGRPQVDARYASIRSDSRHTDVHLVAQVPIAVRRFEHWSMAWLSARQSRLALGALSLDELRRTETFRAAGVLDAMVRLTGERATPERLRPSAIFARLRAVPPGGAGR